MNCPVCLSPETEHALTGTDFLFEATPRTFQLSRCASCRSLFIDPLPTPDEISGFYPTQYWWNASSGMLKTLERIYRRLALRDHVAFIAATARNLRKPVSRVRMLDVGCGSGTLLGILKRRGFDVRGLDVSREAAAIAKSENDVDVVVGWLHDGAFPAGSMDMVTLFHVMEHVTNPRDVLAEVRRILAPGGRLVLQVPNIGSWQYRLFREKWYGLDVPRHVIDYSSQSMQGLLTELGFRVERVRYFNIRDNAPALVSSLAPALDPVSRAVRQRQRNRKESSSLAWIRHGLYLGMVVAAYPFVIAESMMGCGATVMIEAGLNN